MKEKGWSLVSPGEELPPTVRRNPTMNCLLPFSKITLVCGRSERDLGCSLFLLSSYPTQTHQLIAASLCLPSLGRCSGLGLSCMRGTPVSWCACPCPFLGIGQWSNFHGREPLISIEASQSPNYYNGFGLGSWWKVSDRDSSPEDNSRCPCSRQQSPENSIDYSRESPETPGGGSVWLDTPPQLMGVRETSC